MNTKKSNLYFRTIRKDKHDMHTPSVRKLFSQSESVEMSAKLKDIGLTGCMWETYRINALYNFMYGEEHFKKYQKSLGSFLQKALDDEMKWSKSKKIIVSIEPLISTAILLGDKPGVKISILNEDDDGYQTSCFTGFLLSIGRKPGFMEMERLRAEAVILPLFLAAYADDMFLDCVMSFLENNFRCFIAPLKFTNYDLTWMLALWSRPQERNSKSATMLEFDVPVEELSSIKYAIDPNSMSDTWWQTLKPDAANEISEKQVQIFHSQLKKHFYDMFSTDLSHLKLSLVKTPIARVQGDHSIMIFEKDELFPILRHLTHLSQEMRRETEAFPV